MTRQQAEWASTHDWYQSTTKTTSGYLITVQETYSLNNEWFTELLNFNSFIALRLWAGY